jgi:hypothetical protein
MRHLKTHLQQATEKLTETASEANERATYARIRYDRARARKSAAARQQKTGSRKTKVETDADGDEIVVEYEEEEEEGEDDDDDNGIAEKDDDEDNNDDARKLELLESKVKAATDQMDEKIRTLIDADTKLGWTASVIQDIEKDVEASAAASQAAQRRSGLRTNRRQHVHNDEDEDMVDVDADEDDDAGDSDAAPPAHPPSQIVQEKLQQGEAEWQTLSLTQKYVFGQYHLFHGISLNSHILDTLRTTPTSASIVSYTKPNILATTFPRSLPHQHGSHISRTPVATVPRPPSVRQAARQDLRRLRRWTTISPSSGRASP